MLLIHMLHWFSMKSKCDLAPKNIITLCCANRCSMSRLRRVIVLHHFLYIIELWLSKLQHFQDGKVSKKTKNGYNFWEDLEGHDRHLEISGELSFAHWTFPFWPDSRRWDKSQLEKLLSNYKCPQIEQANLWNGKFLYIGEWSIVRCMMQVQGAEPGQPIWPGDPRGASPP